MQQGACFHACHTRRQNGSGIPQFAALHFDRGLTAVLDFPNERGSPLSVPKMIPGDPKSWWGTLKNGLAMLKNWENVQQNSGLDGSRMVALPGITR